MNPFFLRLLKQKKKPSHKGLAVLVGIASFLLFYFAILGPIRQMGSSCSGEGLFNCPFVLVFSLLIGFILMLCAWYLL